MKKALIMLLVVSLVVFASCSKKTDDKMTKNDGVNSYPSKNITFTVPYSAGGGTDSLMRLMTAAMEEDLGKSVIIANKPGNLGQVGLTDLSKQKNDGYSIGALSNLDHILVLLTGENVEYAYDSFEYIGAINTTANVLIASRESGFTTLDQVIAYGKENPGRLTVAISGKTHIAEAALIESASGIEVTTIMQSGGGESLNAILGGHVDLAILDKKFVAQVEGQGPIALAVLSEERNPVIPNIPSMKELGYDVATETYRVIIAPKGVSQDVKDRISATMKKVTSTDEFQSKMSNIGEVFRFLTETEVNAKLETDLENMEMLLSENPDAFK